MPCPFQRGEGCRQSFGGNQQVIRVKRRNRKQADFCISERLGKRCQHADFRQNERTMHFQDAPAGLGMYSHGNERKLSDDGEFITGARNGKEWTLDRPRGDRRVGSEAGNGETLGQQAEFKMAGRSGHGELEQTPHDTTVNGNRGAVLFTVMPSAAYSLASMRARPVTAARIEFEASRPSTACFTADDVIVIRRPTCSSASAAEFPWQKMVFIRSWPRAARQASSGAFLKTLDGGPSELVTQISMRPKRSSTAATKAITASESVTSSACCSTSPPVVS